MRNIKKQYKKREIYKNQGETVMTHKNEMVRKVGADGKYN